MNIYMIVPSFLKKNPNLARSKLFLSIYSQVPIIIQFQVYKILKTTQLMCMPNKSYVNCHVVLYIYILRPYLSRCIDGVLAFRRVHKILCKSFVYLLLLPVNK